ncbi:MAG: 30S ribosomal protein S19e [Candidatus Altiarchaeales archaeon]|nr:MAG: 30S ribosomal protein S19e [Candidatus Altiarchaeales archaeon]
MATVYDVPPDLLIKEVAKDLKERIKLKRPTWALFVKTSVARERQPQDKDWWWIRAASLLRKVYIKGPIGVQRLRKEYGGRKNRGCEPEKFFPGSGKIIRVLLQEFDKLGFTEKVEKGRAITPKGRSYLDKIASRISLESQKKEEKEKKK